MKIWKFEINPASFLVNMPKGAEVISVGTQENCIMIWAKVNPEAKICIRRFPVYGTSHEISEEDLSIPFIGTVIMESFVWHVFDGGEV